MNKLDEYLNYILDGVSKKYKKMSIHGLDVFYDSSTNVYFYIDKIESFNAIFASYATGLVDAKNYVFEDGDLFYPEDMTKEEMLENMLKEIEQ